MTRPARLTSADTAAGGMVLPPVGPDGADREHADSWHDVRIPQAFHVGYGDDRHARPVGYSQGRLPAGAGTRNVPGPCNPTGQWGDNRHLFDALMSEEGDVYVGDDLRPSGFRLVLTCVRCGAVRELSGTLDAYTGEPGSGGDRDRGFVDPVPLQAGELLAQQTSYYRSWGVEHATWSVYRGGTLVGWIATELGPRGKHYVAGGLGRRHLDDHEVVKGPTAVFVLRKLARARTATEREELRSLDTPA